LHKKYYNAAIYGCQANVSFFFSMILGNL